MSKAPPLAPSVVEAQDRLSRAVQAFDSFMSLLAGFNGSGNLKANQIYYLLDPVRNEVSAALDELNVSVN